jgi:hypothetical protein
MTGMDGAARRLTGRSAGPGGRAEMKLATLGIWAGPARWRLNRVPGPRHQAGPEDWRKPMPKEARVALLLAAAACLMAVTVEWVIAELQGEPQH